MPAYDPVRQQTAPVKSVPLTVLVLISLYNYLFFHEQILTTNLAGGKTLFTITPKMNGAANKTGRETFFPGPFCEYDLILSLLEQSGNLTGFRININPPEGRIGAGSRHQADGAGTWTEELGTGVNKHVANRQTPTLGHAFLGRIM